MGRDVGHQVTMLRRVLVLAVSAVGQTEGRAPACCVPSRVPLLSEEHDESPKVWSPRVEDAQARKHVASARARRPVDHRVSPASSIFLLVVRWPRMSR